MLDDRELVGYRTALVAEERWRRRRPQTSSVPCSPAISWMLGPQAGLLGDAESHHGVPIPTSAASTRRRYEYARAVGCDSVDGALLRFDVAVWPRRSVDEPHRLEVDR